jgi:Leucine-rich repeat (LRR) protein
VSKAVSEIVKHSVSTMLNLGDNSLEELPGLKENAARFVLGMVYGYELLSGCVRDRYATLELVVVAGDHIVSREGGERYGSESINEIVSSDLWALGAGGRRALLRDNSILNNNEVSVAKLIDDSSASEVNTLTRNIDRVVRGEDC